jgi:hypothetical protein
MPEKGGLPMPRRIRLNWSLWSWVDDVLHAVVRAAAAPGRSLKIRFPVPSRLDDQQVLDWNLEIPHGFIDGDAAQVHERGRLQKQGVLTMYLMVA